MGLQTFIGSAIYSKLITASGTALWGSRVYNSQAPEGVALPYIVFQQTAGGADQLTPNPTADVEYRIECVGSTKSQARIGAGYIEDAFSLQFAVNVPGYTNYACQEMRYLDRVDNIGGTQYWRQGSFYRFRFAAGS